MYFYVRYRTVLVWQKWRTCLWKYCACSSCSSITIYVRTYLPFWMYVRVRPYIHWTKDISCWLESGFFFKRYRTVLVLYCTVPNHRKVGFTVFGTCTYVRNGTSKSKNSQEILFQKKLISKILKLTRTYVYILWNYSETTIRMYVRVLMIGMDVRTFVRVCIYLNPYTVQVRYVRYRLFSVDIRNF